jgi:hypothetical protein
MASTDLIIILCLSLISQSYTQVLNNSDSPSKVLEEIKSLKTALEEANKRITNNLEVHAQSKNNLDEAYKTISKLSEDKNTLHKQIEEIKNSAVDKNAIEKQIEDVKSTTMTKYAIQKELDSIRSSTANKYSVQKRMDEMRSSSLNKVTVQQQIDDNLSKSASWNPNRFFMYKDASTLYNIFDAFTKGFASKQGNPSGWDDTTYKTTKWYGNYMLRIGVGVQSNENAMKVDIPDGYDVLWMRCANDRYATFRVIFQDGNNEELGKYACGLRNLNEISPTGTAPEMSLYHQWFPIPTARSGQVYVYADMNSDGWISGLAFGKNLWKHARNSAYAYLWNLNGGGTVTWVGDSWNGDNVAKIDPATTVELFVPILYSGTDKLVYMVEFNSSVLGVQHSRVWVKGLLTERFRTSYQNCFATHFNSKSYSRYVAAKIPAGKVGQDDKFISVRIEASLYGAFNFREAGTHDYFY